MPLFESRVTSRFAVFFLLISTIIIVYPILLLEYFFAPSAYLPHFSAVIEELIKCSLLYFFIVKTSPDFKYSILYGLAVGGGYGFIENIIYALNYLSNPYFSSIMLMRFLYPFLIHINASVVFSTLAQKKFATLGIVFAVAIHLIYNIILLG